jgi:hypothetical protein
MLRAMLKQEVATMKLFNTKLILSALGIAAMLTGPAFAQKPDRQVTQQQMVASQPIEQYPESVDGMSHTGSTSNQFEHDHGYYTGS